MYLTTIIKKTVAGIMQSAGGFAEPITRALGVRVRTAAGNTVELTHNDTDATIATNKGYLRLVGDNVLLNGKLIGPTSGAKAARPAAAICPTFHIHNDTDEGEPTYTDDGGVTWYTFGGVDVTA